MSTSPERSATQFSDDELERRGITRIVTERFEIGGYRYDRLADALAEATRRSAEAGVRH